MKQRLAAFLWAALLTMSVVGYWGKPACSQEHGTTAKVGQKAKDFLLPALDGEKYRLSERAGKKIVVLGIGNPFG